MFKVIIAGGRDFDNYEKLVEFCNKVLINKNDIEVVCGMAGGADLLGKRYAIEKGLKVNEFPADWNNIDVEPCVIKTNKNGNKYNTLAGHNRNKLMAENAEALMAFFDGKSKGTKNMIDLATEKGLKIKVFRYNDKPETIENTLF